MNVAMFRKIIGKRAGQDKFSKPTVILTLEEGNELTLGEVWWKRLGSPELGDSLSIGLSLNQSLSESARDKDET